jgi:hypothetical protein
MSEYLLTEDPPALLEAMSLLKELGPEATFGTPWQTLQETIIAAISEAQELAIRQHGRTISAAISGGIPWYTEMEL